MDYALIGLAFAAGATLIFGANLAMADVLNWHRMQVRKRLEEEVRLRQREKARNSMEFKELYELRADGSLDLGPRPTLRQWIVQWIDESGTAIKPHHLGLACAATASIAAVPAWWFAGIWWHSAMAAALTVWLPVLYVWFVRARRMEKLLSQLPDAFDLMSRTMKSGQTISHALQAVADEFSAPISDEFGYCYDQQNLGLSPEAALRELARRTGLLEIKIFVLAVMVHRQTGGNLSELLDNLSKVIRDRYRIRGTIKALTAEGRMQAAILLALPPIMLVVMMAINRPYVMVLFQHPLLLVGTAVSMAFGGLWMHKIVKFDF